MARRATIQLKVHGQIVQNIPLEDTDIECLIAGLREVTPCTQRIDWEDFIRVGWVAAVRQLGKARFTTGVEPAWTLKLDRLAVRFHLEPHYA